MKFFYGLTIQVLPDCFDTMAFLHSVPRTLLGPEFAQVVQTTTGWMPLRAVICLDDVVFAAVRSFWPVCFT